MSSEEKNDASEKKLDSAERRVASALAPIDSVLVERFARDNGTVFVGAGISLGAGLPDWRELMDPLRRDLGIERSELNYLQIAELYEIKNGRAALVQYLKEQLGNVRSQLTRTHELIVELPVKRIYTTNFDSLLEQASQKKQIDRHVISNAAHVGLSDASMLSIVKLHGDLADPHSIVITARDFYGYFARNPTVSDLLKVELQTKTVLFIGYSFSDPNLAMILGNALAQEGATAPRIYSLQFQPKDLHVRGLRARGIEVIPIDAQPGTHAAKHMIEAWLLQFRKALIGFDKQRALSREAAQAIAPVVAPRQSIRRSDIDERMFLALSSDFRVIVVKGEAGAGKSHVVAEVAMNRLQPDNVHFPSEVFERVIWIRAGAPNGGKRYHTLESIFQAIAGQVGVSLSTDRVDLDGQKLKIDSILFEQRLMIVIEDFSDPRLTDGNSLVQVCDKDEKDAFNKVKKWLETGGYANSRSRILVTTRNALIAGFLIEITRLEYGDAQRLALEHAGTISLRKNYDLKRGIVKKLVRYTLGNPLAIRLGLGVLNSDNAASEERNALLRELRDWQEKSGPGIAEVPFKALVDKLWSGLETDGPRQVVVAMLIFPVSEWIPRALIRAAVGPCGAPGEKSGPSTTNPMEEFYRAVRKCVSVGLLEYDASRNACIMHRTIRDLLLAFEPDVTEVFNESRCRLAEYLLTFLERSDVLTRHEIPSAYWNTLVRNEMVRVDPYWATIENTMDWLAANRNEKNDEMLVQFTLLLIHYMDSRFLNAPRLKFVEKAIEILQSSRECEAVRHWSKERAATGKTDEFSVMRNTHILALLHIDALGWTYVEEGRNEKALQHIAAGLERWRAIGAGNDGCDGPCDLHALAYAWQARIAAAEGKLGDAVRLIGVAQRYVVKCIRNNQPWIAARVAMVAGDIHLLENKFRDAEISYLRAERNEERYGGELGYQTDWRIGLALLGQADKVEGNDPRRLVEQAKCRFEKLVENAQVANGRLYGQYGLALIAARKQYALEAALTLRDILAEIEKHRGENNVLLKLTKSTYQNLASRTRV